MKKDITTEELIEYAQENKKIFTSCKGCVFSKTPTTDSENLSDYCSANRLSSFKDKGCEILTVKDTEIIDENKTTYYRGIMDRVCNLMRNKNWSKVITARNNFEFGEDDLEKLEEIARNESRVQCTYIIYMEKDKTKEECLKGIRKTVESFCNRPPNESPVKLTIIVSPALKPSEFMSSMRQIAKELPLPCSWNMEYIIDSNILELEGMDLYESCMRICMKSIKSQYASVFACGEDVPENYLSSLDKLINVDMEKILVCRPKDKTKISGTFIQYMVYKQLRNSPDGNTFMKEIEQLAKEQESEHLIKTLEDVIQES
tara:strand:- start:1453 stop:2400 length:948 start_codon:yes stop_codon:yes gene_type:complete